MLVVALVSHSIVTIVPETPQLLKELVVKPVSLQSISLKGTKLAIVKDLHTIEQNAQSGNPNFSSTHCMTWGLLGHSLATCLFIWTYTQLSTNGAHEC